VWNAVGGAALPVGIGALATYAYYVRPLPTIQFASTVELAAQNVAAINNLQSFVRLGWYVSPIGLLLGSIGSMLLVHLNRNRRTFPLVLFALTEAVIFLGDTRANPVHYWSARRWLPLIIPSFCLAAAYLLVYLWPRARARWIDAVIPVGCTLAMTLSLLGGVRPLLGYVEYRGAINQLGTLAAQFPDNSVLLFANSEAGRRYTAALQFIDRRTSFVIHHDPATDAAAAAAARAWIAQGRPVFWIAAEGPDPFEGPSEIGLEGTPSGRVTISLPEKLATTDGRPGKDGLFQQSLVIWELRP
jgi:hypothetical protein